ncbi:putative DNA binding domain-containing protein [Candidatus Parcubacteria bacterium]|nr:putative DNA binding domain-containing protein [Candidatus Parcubacteria bacterium]
MLKIFKETEKLELKKSTSELKEAIIAIVAILNKHQKGVIYFGIKNNGEIVGQKASEKTIRNISRSISSHIEPKIYPKINKIAIDKKECVKIEFHGNEIPYYAKGRAFIRVGDENKQLSAKEIENIILRKNKDKLRWDKEICEEAKITDISVAKLRLFLKKSGLKYDNLENSLKKLGLSQKNSLLNTAVILFGKKPEKFFPNAKLRCAVFGTDDSSYIIDRQEFTGDLFYLIEKAEEYILKNIHIGMKLEGLYRVDVPEINKKAFREAIINAFCHRDYYSYDSVNIAIFKNRLEIRNHGLLFGGLTIAKIKKENVSERRNELIAEMFHKINFVEKWGKGISLILSKEPTANFKEVGLQFISVFKRKFKEEAEGLAEGLVEGLVENQKKILGFVEKNPQISKKKLSKKIGISATAIDKNILTLKQKGFLKRVGPDKGGYWKRLK